MVSALILKNQIKVKELDKKIAIGNEIIIK
jgi:hypothetical protein